MRVRQREKTVSFNNDDGLLRSYLLSEIRLIRKHDRYSVLYNDVDAKTYELLNRVLDDWGEE